eukprot:GHVH01006779.1.p1 GENE.GHVH01006779.1~~GHVH01006779.1.p1  ORF type:complete len:733 (+),score=99.62 GHVH01006779.1:654-2852(+)
MVNEYGDLISTNFKKIYIRAPLIQGVINAMSSIQSMVEGFRCETFNELIQDSSSVPLHKLESLHKGSSILYGLPYVDSEIRDYPKYPVRGLLVDTARSFVPKHKLFNLIEVLHASKINTIQWHLSDDQSFSGLLGTEQECDDEGGCTRVPWDDVRVDLSIVPPPEDFMKTGSFEVDWKCLEGAVDGLECSSGYEEVYNEHRRRELYHRMGPRFMDELDRLGGNVPLQRVADALPPSTMNITDYIHNPFCRGGRSDEVAPSWCSSLFSSDSYYDRTQVAEVLTYAWMHGISIIFELSSPAHARSWGTGSMLECDILTKDSGSDTMWSDQYNMMCHGDDLSGIPTNNHSYPNACFGNEYQSCQICAEQVCGPLNIQILPKYEDEPLTGLTQQEILSRMRSPRVFKIFDAITDSFDTAINLDPVAKLTKLRNPDLNISVADFENYFNFSADAPKYINDGGILHLGLDLISGFCFDNSNELTPRTAKAVEAWLMLTVEKSETQGWKAMGWYDIILLFPELAHEFTMPADVIPHIWSTTDDYYTKLRVLASEYSTFIWSTWETLYLDCGLSNTGTAGFASWGAPYKTFWDIWNTDPDAFADLALSYFTAAHRDSPVELRSMGAIAPLWGEQQTMFNVVTRVNARLAVLGGATWTGRGTMKSKPSINFTNDVDATFDYSTLDSSDFESEGTWMRWTSSMAHMCYPVSLSKTAWCYLTEGVSSSYCRSYTKSAFEGGRH